MPKTACSLLGVDTASSVLFSHQPQLRHINTFSPYGYESNPQNLIGFTGAVRERVTGNYVLGNGYRLYNPLLMRFLSPDGLSPFGKGGVNAYAYCLGDPVNLRDPQGRSPWNVLNSAKNTVKNIFTPGDIPPEQFSPIRKRLNEQVNQTSKWGTATAVINKALASHSDKNIPEWKAERYITRSWSAANIGDSLAPPSIDTVRKKSLSESSLFFGSALEWGEVAIDAKRTKSDEQLGAALVGATFNAAGGVLAGAHDHMMYKKGLILTKPSNQVSTIRR